MRARDFWLALTADRSDLLARFLALVTEHRIHYCLVGGQAINAYVEPVVSFDLDLAVPREELPLLERLLTQQLRIERLMDSLNVTSEGSDLRIQIQTDPRYAPSSLALKSGTCWACGSQSRVWKMCCREKYGQRSTNSVVPPSGRKILPTSPADRGSPEPAKLGSKADSGPASLKRRAQR
jgi:hypothetical protein